jgi:hypothetical protein
MGRNRVDDGEEESRVTRDKILENDNIMKLKRKDKTIEE